MPVVGSNTGSDIHWCLPLKTELLSRFGVRIRKLPPDRHWGAIYYIFGRQAFILCGMPLRCYYRESSLKIIVPYPTFIIPNKRAPLSQECTIIYLRFPHKIKMLTRNRIIIGIGENGEQYICHIAEDDNDGSLHHYLELVNHKNETTKYVFVDGDVEDCEIIQASLRRVSWKKALSGDKYEINHPDNFKIINNILSNTHTSSHVILSPTSIEKIAYDNAKMANNKSQKYNDVILKKCANLGATMIRECLGTDSTEVHKKLSDKLRSLDIELLAEEIQGDRLFDMDELIEYLIDFFIGLFDEISCAASYLYPVDFDYRFSAKVLEQIKMMESKGIQFELMALKLLLNQNSMQNWLEEQNLGDYIE